MHTNSRPFRSSLVVLLLLAARCHSQPSVGPLVDPSTPPPPSRCVLPARPNLFISFVPLSLEPGASRSLSVIHSSHPGAVDRLPDSCTVQWSIAPSEHATIDPASGRLTVATTAPPGARFMVRATVENLVAEVPATVFDSRAHPLRGNWREYSRTRCDGRPEPATPPPVPELTFRTDGTFEASVNFVHPHGPDFRGTFTLDTGARLLALTPEPGDGIPRDFDGAGTIEFVSPGRVILRESWFGSRSGYDRQGICHVTYVRDSETPGGAMQPREIVADPVRAPPTPVTARAAFVALGHRYQLFERAAVTWEQARTACESLNATLAAIETEAEYQRVLVRQTSGWPNLIWLAGGSCDADAGAGPLCWRPGVPLTFELRAPYWIRNGQNSPRTHVFLYEPQRFCANSDFLDRGAGHGYLCEWAHAGSH